MESPLPGDVRLAHAEEILIALLIVVWKVHRPALVLNLPRPVVLEIPQANVMVRGKRQYQEEQCCCNTKRYVRTFGILDCSSSPRWSGKASLLSS